MSEKKNQKKTSTPRKKGPKAKKQGKGKEEAYTPPGEKISKDNLSKSMYLPLSVRLTDTEVVKLQGASPLPIVNGSEPSSHAYMNAARHVLVWNLIKTMTDSNCTFTDIQGKPRGPGLCVNGKNQPYPHVCREIITDRDKAFFNTRQDLKPHHCTQHPGRFDAAFMVDVLSHLTPSQLAFYVDSVKQKSIACIGHDYLRHVEKSAKLVCKANSLSWIREVPGHADPTPDYYQPWLLCSSLNTVVDRPVIIDGEITDVQTVNVTLTFQEWGPTIDSMCTVRVSLTEGHTSNSYEHQLAREHIEGSFWDFARLGLRVGLYTFSTGKLHQRTVDVLAGYVVFTDDTVVPHKLKVLDRESVAATIKNVGGRPVTTGLCGSAMREVSNTVSNVDRQAVQETLKGLVDSNYAMDEPDANHRLNFWDKILPARTIDAKAKEALKMSSAVQTEAPATTPWWTGVSGKTIYTALKSGPLLMSLLPVIGSLVYAWKRGRPNSGHVQDAVRGALQRTSVSANTWDVTLDLIWPRTWYQKMIRGAFPSLVALYAAYSQLTSAGASRATALKFLKGQVWGAMAAPHWIAYSVPVLGIVGFSPLAEELFKQGCLTTLVTAISWLVGDLGASTCMSLGIGIGLTFGVVEQLMRPHENRDVRPLIMHTGIGSLPFIPRLLVHSFWNATAVVYQMFGGRKPLSSGVIGPLTDDGLPGYPPTRDMEYPPLDPAAKLTIKVKGKTVQYVEPTEAQLTKPMIFPHGVVFSGYIPTVQITCPQSLIWGLRTRSLFETIKPVKGLWSRVLALDQKLLPFNFGKQIVWVTFDEWLSRYDGSRKSAILKRIDTMTDSSGRSEYCIDPFNKIEFNHSQVDGEFTPKDPRVISGQKDVGVQIESGPFFMSWARAVSLVWDGHNVIQGSHCPVIILKFGGIDPLATELSPLQRFAEFVDETGRQLSALTRAAAIAVSGDDSVVRITHPALGMLVLNICADAHRWDVHFGEEALEAESEYYSLALMNYPNVYTAEGICVSTSESVRRGLSAARGGRFDSSRFKNQEVEIKGYMPPGRRSGSANTTEGNGLGNVHGCYYLVERLHAYLDAVGYLSPLSYSKEEIVHLVKHTWKDLGFKVDVNVSDDPCDVDFCSARVMPVGGATYVVPKIGRVLRRLGCSVGSKRTVPEIQAILAQLQPYAFVPFLGVVICKMTQLYGLDLTGTALVPEDVVHSAWYGIKSVIPPPQEDTWKWFSKTYCLTQHDHDIFAQRVNSITMLPFLMEPCEVAAALSIDS